MEPVKKPLIALAAAVAVWTLPARAQLFTFLHFVGSPGGASYEDGSGSSVHFHTPVGVAVDSSGNVYVADSVNHVIRRVSPNGVATTFAGRAGQIGAAGGWRLRGHRPDVSNAQTISSTDSGPKDVADRET